VIALDVGGTDIKAAVSNADGTELARGQRPTPVSNGVPAVLDAVVGQIEWLRGQVEPGCRVRGVGLVAPGLVDPVAGIARYSVNIGWRDVPLRDVISSRTGLPVAIEHDVRAAGLAEARLGAARGASNALYVAIGTGIAAAVILGGTVLAGSAGMAGEIGHLPAVPDGELCACGQRGCAEAYASGAALARRYLAAGGAPAGAGQPLRAQQVLARAVSGDHVAAGVLDDAVTALGRALVSATLLLDPSLIVIGGGVVAAGPALFEPLAAELARGLAWRGGAPELVPAAFGADSGRRGAALVGWQAHRRAEDGPPTGGDPAG
jgi:glucokinase